MTKKRSKPRAVWVAFDNDGWARGSATNKPYAYQYCATLDTWFPKKAPHTPVKYVREVKRGKR